jgi:hypothetical protein
MTLYEAKGLEFNDVLLYNFFTDSMAALPEWRVVLNVVEDCRGEHISAPRFDDSRHALLCSEVRPHQVHCRYDLAFDSDLAQVIVRWHHACALPSLDIRHHREGGTHARET